MQRVRATPLAVSCAVPCDPFQLAIAQQSLTVASNPPAPVTCADNLRLSFPPAPVTSPHRVTVWNPDAVLARCDDASKRLQWLVDTPRARQMSEFSAHEPATGPLRMESQKG